ncbi:LysR family transcriptional regulator YfiE [Klebsiella pneumoniae subsp. ozaenae]|uniref:LysR family transcriptional regulator YfiE n=1 Tax=Klebsiella pneumoniae subsp. ozaenae TaxID=574 RepID=A0A378BZ28_KLEPO|nr:LysR family transcriptional regulator YfiE [Klebsiella pneumoniae subsp. ozaenae]
MPSRCLRKSAGGCVSPPAGKKVLPHVYDLTKVMASIRQAARQDDEPGRRTSRRHWRNRCWRIKCRGCCSVLSNALRKCACRCSRSTCYSIPRCAACRRGRFGGVLPVGNDDALTIMELGQQSLALVASVEQAPVDFMRPRQQYPAELYHQRTQCVFRQIFESTLRQREITLENTIELWSIESIKQCVAGKSGSEFSATLCGGGRAQARDAWLSCHSARRR